MKYLVLLFALFATAAKAETILMQCVIARGKVEIFKYSDGWRGLGERTFEQRLYAMWEPICVEGSARSTYGDYWKAECNESKKHISEVRRNRNDEPILARYVDFVGLIYTIEDKTYPCRRIDAD